MPNTTKLAPDELSFGSSKGAPTIKSSNPSPFTSPAELAERPELSPPDTPLITKPPAPASTADSSTAVPSVLPNTTKLAPERSPFGSSPLAPTIRSSNPSPFTSPAELTEPPDSSSADTPLITKPLPSELPKTSDSSTAVPSVLPNTTKLAPALMLPFGSSPLAPTIRSSNPSPFTSPAELTETPEKSPSETPLITKPPVPASIAVSSIAGNPSVPMTATSASTSSRALP